MNECNVECVSLGARRRDGSFQGKEGHTEKRVTRKSRKQGGEQKVCMRKPERYLKDCILYEQEEELYWQEDEEHAQIWEEMEADDDARWWGLERRYVEFRFRTEEWYNQNIYPKRMTLLRQLQYAAECRHTLALCSELCDQG
jgi:hypothetical protein